LSRLLDSTKRDCDRQTLLVRKQQHGRFLANLRRSAFNGCEIVCGQYCDWQNYRSRIENFHFPSPRELGCQASSLTLVQLTHSTLKLVINPNASSHNRVERPSSRILDSDCRVVYFFLSYVGPSKPKGQLSQENHVEKRGVRYPYRFFC
jgi:hypothetical protein